MRNVVKIFVNRGFTPIDNSVLKIGTSIDFDCYVQRFNGFFILIKAGTFLDEARYKKIISRPLQIYMKTSEYDKYKKYKAKNTNKKHFLLEDMTLEEAQEKCLEVGKLFALQSSVEEKLRTLYYLGKNLLGAYLNEKRNQKLPVKALEELVEMLALLVNENRVTLSSFHNIIEDRYSLPTHLLNVTFFTALIGSQIQIDLTDQKYLLMGAILHDIGKSEIDESLLDKPDFLTKEEFDTIKMHSQKGIELALKNGVKNRHIISAIKDHHERLDGSGYPFGLTSLRISQFGKILAVCDVFDALITVKPYRGAYTTFNALKLIREEFKNRLDLKYVNILIKLLK